MKNILLIFLCGFFIGVQASKNSSHRTVYGYANYDMNDWHGRVTLEDAARACCATKNSWKRVSKMQYYANERYRKNVQENYDQRGLK